MVKPMFSFDWVTRTRLYRSFHQLDPEQVHVDAAVSGINFEMKQMNPEFTWRRGHCNGFPNVFK
jgi:hypothetical protein